MRSRCTASVSPGAAPSTKNGPVWGFPPSVTSSPAASYPEESTHQVCTVSPLATCSTGSCDPIVTWKCSGSKSCVAMRQHLREILVAAAAEADDDVRLLQLARASKRVRRLERRNDPFGARQNTEGIERLVV